MAFTNTGGNPSSVQGTTAVDVLGMAPYTNNFVVKGDKENDIIRVDSPTTSDITNVTVYGQDGADKITAESTKVIAGLVQGGKGADTITLTGDVSQSTVYGGADGDTINVNIAFDSTLQGSKGNDVIRQLVGGNELGVKLTNSAAFGGEGNDTVNFNEIIGATVQGSKGNDTLNMKSGDSVASKINGGSENDTITIEAAVGELFKGTTLNGNKGSDKITIATTVIVDEITIFGGSGNDNITVTDTQATVSGDKGEDIILGGTGDKVSLSGGEGDDKIQSQSAAGKTTSVNGGVAIDQVTLGAAGSTIVMQGRTDSNAATKVSGASATGDKVVEDQTFFFGNEVDVITNFDIGTDNVALQLVTTDTNIYFGGNTGNAAAFRKDLQAVNEIEFNDLEQAGATTVLAGVWNETLDTFEIAYTNGANDLMIIQGNGAAVTANSSIVILDNVTSGDNAATSAQILAAFGGSALGAIDGTYKA